MILKLNKIIFFLIAYMLLVSSAVAKCDFGIKIGENISDKFEGEYGIANKIAEEENIPEEENIYAENTTKYNQSGPDFGLLPPPYPVISNNWWLRIKGR